MEEFTNPHHADLLPGCLQVNANKEAFEGPFLQPVLIDKIRINHYWTRDERFFKNVKIPRRQKWQDNNFTERANNINKEVDKAIFKYIPQLKKALKKK